MRKGILKFCTSAAITSAAIAAAGCSRNIEKLHVPAVSGPGAEWLSNPFASLIAGGKSEQEAVRLPLGRDVLLKSDRAAGDKDFFLVDIPSSSAIVLRLASFRAGDAPAAVFPRTSAVLKSSSGEELGALSLDGSSGKVVERTLYPAKGGRYFVILQQPADFGAAAASVMLRASTISVGDIARGRDSTEEAPAEIGAGVFIGNYLSIGPRGDNNDFYALKLTPGVYTVEIRQSIAQSKNIAALANCGIAGRITWGNEVISELRERGYVKKSEFSRLRARPGDLPLMRLELKCGRTEPSLAPVPYTIAISKVSSGEE